jgi:hypothetical protein
MINLKKWGTGLLFIVLIILFLSNEYFFRWARQSGITESNTYNLLNLKVDKSGKLPDYQMAFDSKDNLWLAGGGEVRVIRPDGSSKSFHIMWDDAYMSFAVDSQDQVWIGGTDGLRVP